MAFLRTRPQKFGAMLMVLGGVLLALGATGLGVFALLVGGGMIARAPLRRGFRAISWSVRNRLLLTYALIGVVPIVLLIALGNIGMRFLGGQALAGLVRRRMVDEAATLALHLRPSELPAMTVIGAAPQRWPDSLWMVRDDSVTSPACLVLTSDGRAWSETTWSAGLRASDGWGLCYARGRLWRFAREHIDGRTLARLVRVRPSDVRAWTRADSIGIGRRVHEPLKVEFTGSPKPTPGATSRASTTHDADDLVTVSAYDWESDSVSLDNVKGAVRWPLMLAAEDWSTRQSTLVSPTIEGVAATWTVVGGIFFEEVRSLGWAIFAALSLIAGLFAILAAVAFLVGGAITRGITRSLGDLSRGTAALAQGDLSTQIPVRKADQLGELAASFNRMTASLAEHIVALEQSARLRGEIDAAARVQKALFPRPPVVPGWHLAAQLQSASECSGDLVDWYAHADGSLDVMIADVCGHGMAAAVTMAQVQGIFHSLAPRETLGDAIHALNRALYDRTGFDQYSTFVWARLSADARTLEYCNCGHPPPWLGKPGAWQRLTEGGVMAGAFETYPFVTETMRVHPGDWICLVSDGIEECGNASDEFFGEPRMAAIWEAECRADAEPAEVVATLLDAIGAWRGLAKQGDDETVVVLKARGM